MLRRNTTFSVSSDENSRDGTALNCTAILQYQVLYYLFAHVFALSDAKTIPYCSPFAVRELNGSTGVRIYGSIYIYMYSKEI
jgi:hypothetical protein